MPMPSLKPGIENFCFFGPEPRSSSQSCLLVPIVFLDQRLLPEGRSAPLAGLVVGSLGLDDTGVEELGVLGL